MSGKDWKKAMEEAGFLYMDFVKSAKEGVWRPGADSWASRFVIVQLEIRLPNGFFSLATVRVDMTLIDLNPDADSLVCAEALKPIRAAEQKVGVEGRK